RPKQISRRNQLAAGSQETAASIDNRWKMPAEQRQCAAEVRDDDVCFFSKCSLRRKRTNAFDTVCKSICASRFPGDFNCAARLDRINLPCTVSACEQAKYSGPRTNVDYNRIAPDGML